MQFRSTRSLRRAYLEWIEEQIESFKERASRAELMELADQVIQELHVNHRGQYQLTEVLLCEEVDRKIFHLLELPGYRHWCAARLSATPRIKAKCRSRRASK